MTTLLERFTTVYHGEIAGGGGATGSWLRRGGAGVYGSFTDGTISRNDGNPCRYSNEDYIPESADYSVWVDFVRATDEPQPQGVIGRFDHQGLGAGDPFTGQKGIGLVLDPAAAEWQLVEIDGDTITPLDTAPTGATVDGQRIRAELRMLGSNAKIFIGGINVCSGTTTVLAAGVVGLYSDVSVGVSHNDGTMWKLDNVEAGPTPPIRKPSLANTARNAAQCAPEDASLWTGMVFAVPAVEGEGAPKELVSEAACGPPAGGDPPVFEWQDIEGGLKGVRAAGENYWGVTGRPPITAYPLTMAGVIYVPDAGAAVGDILNLANATSFIELYFDGSAADWLDIYSSSTGVAVYDQFVGGTLTPGLHTAMVVLPAEGENPVVYLDGIKTTLSVVLPAFPAGGLHEWTFWSGDDSTLGGFAWTRVLTDAEISRWFMQPFGLATRPWRKPAPWAYDPAKSAAPADAADLGLLLAAWERSGEPKNLVTGDTLTRSGGVAWAEREGCPVLRFDGATGYIVVPAPVIGEATDYTMLMVLKNSDTVGTVDQMVYEEDGSDGQIHDYTQAGYIRGTAAATGVFSDHWNNTTEEELYNATHGEVKDLDFSGLRVVVVRRSGRNLTIWVDGEQMADQPPSYVTDGTVSIAAVLATIGATHHSVGPDEFTHFLNADLALLAIAPGVAWSDERIAARSADPMALLQRDYAKPLSTVGWTPATSLVPAVATKAKILFPFTEGSSNPKELVSGETLTLEDGDEWATANGLLGITLVDYTDGSTPGTDVAGRLLDSYGPAFHAPCVLWALVSIPTNPANILGLDLYLFGWNSYGITIQLYPGEVFSGGEVIFGGFYAGDGTNTLVGGSLGIPSLPPGSLVSVVIVCKPGEVLAIYYNEVPVASVHSYNTGTVNSGDATEDHETPFSIAQGQNHDDNGVEVPDTDRFVIHGAGIFEGMTDPEIAAFVADPMNVLRQAEAGGGGASGVRRRRRRVLLAQR